jgi:hypothetical protein
MDPGVTARQDGKSTAHRSAQEELAEDGIACAASSRVFLGIEHGDLPEPNLN